MGGTICTEEEQIDQNFLELRGLGPFDRAFLISSRRAAREWKDKKPTVESCRIPTQEGGKTTLLLSTSLPAQDEDWEAASIVEKFMGELVAGFEVAHSSEQWESPEVALDWIKKFMGDEFPKMDSDVFPQWGDAGTNQAFTNIHFLGLGAFSVSRVTDRDREVEKNLPPEAEFYSDLRFMRMYPTEDGFPRYGSGVVWDANRNLLGIYVCYNETFYTCCDNYNEDLEWEHAKFVHQSTMGMYVTVVKHLGYLHLTVANALAVSCYHQLGCDHPLRRFLKPATFRVTATNVRSTYFLISEGGIAHRLFAFDYNVLSGLVGRESSTLRLRSVREMIEDNGMTDVAENDPLNYCLSDGLEFEAIVERYVRGYLDIYYRGDWDAIRADRQAYNWFLSMCSHVYLDPDDGSYDFFVRLVTNVLVHCTGLHKMWGTTNYARFFAEQGYTRFREGQHKQDVQSYIQTNALAVATTLEQLKMTLDYSHLLLRDEHFDETKALMEQYRNELMAYHEKIEKLNDQRAIRCDFFNPPYVDAGVAV